MKDHVESSSLLVVETAGSFTCPYFHSSNRWEFSPMICFVSFIDLPSIPDLSKFLLDWFII